MKIIPLLTAWAVALGFAPVATFAKEPTAAKEVAAAPKETWDAIGLNVLDGNTIEVSKDGQVYRLLLAQIGAPARGQNYSKEARTALKEMVYGQKLNVVIDREDRLGRLISQVNVGATNVNNEMVKKGWAWVYRKFTEEPKVIALEDAARKAKVGLWQDENPVAPWDYRREQRKLRAEQPKAAEVTEQAKVEIKK